MTFPDTRTHYSGVIPMVFAKVEFAAAARPGPGASGPPGRVATRGISAARIQRTPDRVNAGIDEP